MDPDVLESLKRQHDDLKRRCAKGQATAADCAQLFALEASIESGVTGVPVADVVAKKKASRTFQYILVGAAGLYLVSILSRFRR